MNQRKVKVKIDVMGNPTVEAEGFVGVSCESATGPIEKALASGNISMTREMKGEYFANEEATQEQHQSW